MLGKTLAICSFVSLGLLMFIVNMTTPSTIGPLGILVVFVLMYLVFLGAISFALYFLNPLIKRFARFAHIGASARSASWSMKRSYYYSSVVSLAPVMVVGMQSVSDISIYDLALVVLFVLLSCVYITKRAY